MNAERIKAAEVNVGDRLLYHEQEVVIQKIERSPFGGYWFWDCPKDEFLFHRLPGACVWRILPAPLEVREFWQAECCSMAKEGTEQECRARTIRRSDPRLSISGSKLR